MKKFTKLILYQFILIMEQKELKELKKIHIPDSLRKYIHEFKEDKCKYITGNGKRCKFGTTYRNKETGETKDCSKFCSVYLNENCKAELYDIINILLYDKISTSSSELSPIRKSITIDSHRCQIVFFFLFYDSSTISTITLLCGDESIEYNIKSNGKYSKIYDGYRARDRRKKGKEKIDKKQYSIMDIIMEFCNQMCDIEKPDEIEFEVELTNEDIEQIISIGRIVGWKANYDHTYHQKVIRLK